MSVVVAKQELPKAFSQEQQPYTTLDNIRNSKKDKREDVRQEFDKQMDGFLKMYISSLQNQDPFSEKSQADSGVQIAGQMAQMQIFGRMNDQLAELVDNFAMSEILKATEFQGQEVSFDDNIRDFSGSEVTFDYELKYPSSVKNSSSVKCFVKIYDKKNLLVYNGKSTGTIEGKNKFSWNGKDNKGVKVPNGKYRIEVSASANAPDGTPIHFEAMTYRKGIVTSIHMTEEGKIQLELADGSKIDQDKVKKLTDLSAVQPLPAASSGELAGYIGKQVSVDLSSIEVKNGRSELTYNNANPLANPGKVTVEIWGTQGLVKKLDFAGLEPGVGKLQLDATGIEDGKYSCKIFVEDKDNEDNRVELTYKDTIDVSRVDVAAQSIIGDGKEYSVKNIAGMERQSHAQQSLITQASNYFGKNVTYNVSNDFFYDGNNFAHEVSIPKLPQGYALTSAALEVYNGEELVARVEKAGGDVYGYNSERVPFFDGDGVKQALIDKNGILDKASRRAVRRYIQELRLPGVEDYSQLNETQKVEINKYIEQQFRAGNFFKQGQDRADEATKLKNMGIIKFDWDGTMLSGSKGANGKQYSYQVKITTTNAGVTHDEYLPERSQSSVKATEMVNDALTLILANGERIAASQVLAVGL